MKAPSSFLAKLTIDKARQTLFGALSKLKTGKLRIIEGDQVVEFGNFHHFIEPSAEIEVLDGRFYTSLLFGGSVGAGESYMRGEWHTHDLPELVRLMARNLAVLNSWDSQGAALKRPLMKLWHKMRRNTHVGSRRNISAHYDLGNDFFSAWLDRDLMYSSAVFPSADADLDQASINKLDRICKKLDLGPDDHVVEIGTGWGGFAVYAAGHYGCRVTTCTISKEQFTYARERVYKAGLSPLVSVVLRDYRDMEGTFDKLVSIEMIEAVGHHYLDRYLQKCASLLKEDGAMLIQAITIPENRYEEALHEVDFIKRHIFPGSFIPSIGAVTQALAKTDLQIHHLEDQAVHYARTLQLWRERFLAAADTPALQHLSPQFKRMWEFYLAYCEGGFREHAIGCAQIMFRKPLNRTAPLLIDLDHNREQAPVPGLVGIA